MDSKRFSWFQSPLAVIAGLCAAFMLLAAVKHTGVLSPWMERLILLALMVTFGYFWFLRVKTVREVYRVDLKNSLKAELAIERKKELARKLQRLIAFMLILFCVAEWLMKEESLSRRLLGTAFSLIFIGWWVSQLLRLRRSINLNSDGSASSE
jgi:hypothetical protein